MLSDYFEDFILLQHTESEGDLGDSPDAFSEALTFRGGVTHVAGAEVDAAGKRTLRTVPTLLHEWDVTLCPGDCIRRASDGALYRVIGSSDSERTPLLAGLRYAQVPVERLVSA